MWTSGHIDAVGTIVGISLDCAMCLGLSYVLCSCQVFMSLCYLGKYYVILGYVNVLLVQHLMCYLKYS